MNNTALTSNIPSADTMQGSQYAPTKPILLIIELDYHAEVLAAICPVLSEKFTLILWTTEKIWQRTHLQEELFQHLLITSKKSSLRKFWQLNERTIASADLVYFNTLEKNSSFFNSIQFSCPVIIRIHNVNSSLFPLDSIDWSIRKFPKIATYIIRKMFLYDTWPQRKQLFLKASLLMLPNTSIKDLVEPRLIKLGYNNISDYCLPFFSLGTKQEQVEQTEEIVIGITGSIDPDRKNYEDVSLAIRFFMDRHPRVKLRLIFLGSPRGNAGLAIIKNFQNLENQYFKVDSYKNYVPQEEVEKRIKEVHFIVAPIKLKTKHKIHKEYYGKTKVSGLECDAVNYRKPVVLPSEYTSPKSLNSIFIGYSNTEELYEKIEELGVRRKYKEVESEFNNMPFFLKENIASDFYALYQDLISSKD